MRKLTTVREISNLLPIAGADFIELAQVDGWQCIVKKGDFEEGGYGVFFEIDSALDARDERYDFLRKSNTKKLMVDGVEKEVIRIRSMKMKGVLSQGLLLPLATFQEELDSFSDMMPWDLYSFNVDLTKVLGVHKYEKPLPAGNTRSGKPSGNFPSFIRKTDQERVQNIFNKLDAGESYAATLKMHGSSATLAYVTEDVYKNPSFEVDDAGGHFYVCSRNWALKEEEDCIWWKGAVNSNLLWKIKDHHIVTGENLAIQGELCGPGINGTHEKFDDYRIMVFSIWDIDNQEYLPYDEFSEKCSEIGIEPSDRVPLIKLTNTEHFDSVKDYLDFAESIESPYTDIPEGIVFHSNDYPFHSFKAVSNHFLMNGGE